MKDTIIKNEINANPEAKLISGLIGKLNDLRNLILKYSNLSTYGVYLLNKNVMVYKFGEEFSIYADKTYYANANTTIAKTYSVTFDDEKTTALVNKNPRVLKVNKNIELMEEMKNELEYVKTLYQSKGFIQKDMLSILDLPYIKGKSLRSVVHETTISFHSEMIDQHTDMMSNLSKQINKLTKQISNDSTNSDKYINKIKEQSDEIKALTDEIKYHNDIISKLATNYSDKYKISLTIKTLKALKALHNKGVIHNDIKPDNMILGRDGKIYIIDYQFSKKLNDGIYNDSIFGTHHYAAPEVFKYKTSEKTDIYAIGLVIAEIFGVFNIANNRVNFLTQKNKTISSESKSSNADIKIAKIPLDYTSLEDIPVAIKDIIISCTQDKMNARPTAAELLKSIKSNFPVENLPSDEDLLTQLNIRYDKNYDPLFEDIMEVTLWGQKNAAPVNKPEVDNTMENQLLQLN